MTDNETEVNTLKQRLHDLQERCKFTESCLHDTSAMLENTKSLVNEEKIKVGWKYLLNNYLQWPDVTSTHC